jgi:(2R)-ethylmalonyl-CoA mutase
MRAFTSLWDEITRERYGVTDAKLRRFRYGVQVNSLGLTERQPENNAWRILIEALGVTLSRDARCRALQLPTWNEALSLPRPWDQQWSLRLQQILAYETDLLEYPDLFEGSVVVEGRTRELAAEARAEIDRILALGGVRAAVESGYMKAALVRSMSERVSKIDRAELTVVGVNKWAEGLPSPLVGGDDGGIFHVDQKEVDAAMAALAETRTRRDGARAAAALDGLRAAARSGAPLMEPSIECALARVTTGEWADALREVFGEYRAVTGVEGQSLRLDDGRLAALRARIDAFAARAGRRPRLVVGKPGLDGHSNGAEVIAVAARHAGFDVVYGGIRLTPAEIVASAIEEDADLVGISVLSGSHLELAGEILGGLRAGGAADVPVVVGGIIPEQDAAALTARGVAAVFTPSDFELIGVMERMMGVIEESAAA